MIPLRLLSRRIITSFFILLVIAFLTQAGIYLAQMGQSGIPASAGDAFWNSIRETYNYLVDHPASYPWHKESVPALQLTLSLLGKSTGLLLFSLALAALLGGLLGIAAAMLRKRQIAPLMLLLSILGISTPSFLFAMLLWVLNIQLYHLFGLRSAPFPPTGFGWDAHIVLPALVLAARPLAQIMQVTYIHLAQEMNSDYIRAAKAKGVSNYLQLIRHALPNILVPTLTTLGTSLRFSLASLPIVESFFLWEGIGLGLLQAIASGLAPLVTDMIVALGLLFILFNLALEIIYPIIDPRLHADMDVPNEDALSSWNEQRYALRDMLADIWLAIWRPIARIAGIGRSSPGSSGVDKPGNQLKPARLKVSGGEAPHTPGGGFKLRQAFLNPPLLSGTVLVLLFIILAAAGGAFSPANAYETHGVMTIEGEIQAPPFSPSSIFPWGSDPIGRDIQALILSGAKLTLSLALFGMLARVLTGVVVGMLAGWWQNSWLDRLTSNLVAVWAAFPATLFAMILILGLGIQRGLVVFVIALCVVGWSEIAQFIRAQVISQKPKLYVEAARSMGANPLNILGHHILPNLLPSILVFCALEMGAVLMLLAELGFLNIFLGGGFKAMIGEGANMEPINFNFSDVPEWGALLANIRNWWRSYPWLVWYPGIFFFLAIFTFNLWGEGLRRLFEESKINLRRVFSRYTLLAVGTVAMITVLLFRTTTPLRLYRPQAEMFSAEQALVDLTLLSSPQYRGREAGTESELQAADFIAGRMAEIGLFTGWEKGTYLQTRSVNRYHLTGTPVLQIIDDAGNAHSDLKYRRDFVEYVSAPPIFGEATGRVIGLVFGAGSDGSINIAGLKDVDLSDKAVIVRPGDIPLLKSKTCAALLVIGDGSDFLQKNFFSQNWAVLVLTGNIPHCR